MRHLTCFLLSCIALSGIAQLSPEDQSAIESNCRKVAELHSQFYMDADFDIVALRPVQSAQLVTIDSLRQIGWNLEDIPRPEEPVVFFTRLEVEQDSARCYFRNPDGEPYFANVEHRDGWKIVGYYDQTYPADYVADMRTYIDSLVRQAALFGPYQATLDAFGEAYQRFLDTQNSAELQGVLTPNAIDLLDAMYTWGTYEDPDGAEAWPALTVTEARSAEGYIKCYAESPEGDRTTILLQPQRDNTYLVAGFKGRLATPERVADLRNKYTHAVSTQPLRAQLSALKQTTTAYLRGQSDHALPAVTTPSFQRAIEGFADRLGPYNPEWLIATGPSGAKWSASDIRIEGDSAWVSHWRHTLILIRESDTWKAADLLDQSGTPLSTQPQLTHFEALENLLSPSYNRYNTYSNEEDEMEIEAVELDTEIEEVEWLDDMVEMPPAPEQAEIPGPPQPAVELDKHPVPTQGWQAFIDAFTAAHPLTDQHFQAEIIIEKDGSLGDIHIQNSGGGPHAPVTQLLQSLTPTWTPARHRNNDVRSTLHLILYPTP